MLQAGERTRNGAESVLTPRHPARHLPAETARRSTITQIYEGTNQIQRVVLARQLLVSSGDRRAAVRLRMSSSVMLIAGDRFFKIIRSLLAGQNSR
jgi:hypothetical protein